MSSGPTRREFMDLAATAIAAGLAASIAGCQDTLRGRFGGGNMAAAMNGPLPVAGPRKVASLSALTTTPTGFPVTTLDGGEMVYAYLEGDKPVVLSNLCTHRGCAVTWEAGKSHYYCPCHNGAFDKGGKVLFGPPLGPLNSYPVELKSGDIYIQG